MPINSSFSIVPLAPDIFLLFFASTQPLGFKCRILLNGFCFHVSLHMNHLLRKIHYCMVIIAIF
ncbi:hypothetical protein Fmac_013200 [Flemingia macrophylla]|uniref:Uncharacterized protein n=1 Tax=Flemingia macrophylla TaxID=520843 RepID=A0ABD1MSJ0_9FABA